MSDGFGGLPPAPRAPEGYGPTAARGPRPSTVENAFRLMLVSAVLGVVDVVITLSTKSDLRTRIEDANPGRSSARVDHLLNTAVTIGIVTAVVITVLYVLLALQVRKGRNWARIVTWVIAGLGVLGTLTAFANSATPLSRGFTIVGGLIDISIIVLLAMGPSNRYFVKH